MSDQPQTGREKFGFNFVTLARRWRRAIEQELAQAGLTDATWTPLIHLSEGGDNISQTELAGRVGLDTSTLVRLLDILCERGLIERRPDPGDRRTRLIALTAAGETELTRIRAHLRAIELELLADIGDDEIASMLDGFHRIGARTEALLQRRRA